MNHQTEQATFTFPPNDIGFGARHQRLNLAETVSRGSIGIIIGPGLHGRSGLLRRIAERSRMQGQETVGWDDRPDHVRQWASPKKLLSHLATELSLAVRKASSNFAELLDRLDRTERPCLIAIDIPDLAPDECVEWLMAGVHAFAERADRCGSLSLWLAGGFKAWKLSCGVTAPYQIDAIFPRQLERADVLEWLQLGLRLPGKQESLRDLAFQVAQRTEGDVLGIATILRATEVLVGTDRADLETAVRTSLRLFDLGALCPTRLIERAAMGLTARPQMHGALRSLADNGSSAWQSLAIDDQRQLFDCGLVSMRQIGPNIRFRLRAGLASHLPSLKEIAESASFASIVLHGAGRVSAEFEGFIESADADECWVQLRDRSSGEVTRARYSTSELRRAGALETGRFSLDVVHERPDTTRLVVTARKRRPVDPSAWLAIIQRTADLDENRNS